MSSSFLRWSGAFADTKELEYISALHQTCLPETRTNGTVSATDVRTLLVSRYGLKVSFDEALEIIRGLGGPSTTQQEDIKVLGKEKSFFVKRIARNVTQTVRDTLSTSLASPNSKDLPSTNNGSTKDGRSSSSLGKVEEGGEAEDGASDPGDSNDNAIEESKKPEKPVVSWGTSPEKEFRRHTMLATKSSGPGAGADEFSQEIDQYVDIVQIVSLLLIPELCEFASVYDPNGTTGLPEKAISHDESPNNEVNILEEVLEIMLSDVVDLFEALEADEDSERLGPKIDADLIRGILSKYDELELIPDDQLVQEMIDCTQSSRLDAKAFARALTFDVREYWDTDSRNRVSSHYFDVFREDRGVAYYRKHELFKMDGVSHLLTREGAARNPQVNQEEGGTRQLKPLFSSVNSIDHSNVDSVLDTYTTGAGMVCLWLFFMSFAIYGVGSLEYLRFMSCQAESNFLCAILKHTLRW